MAIEGLSGIDLLFREQAILCHIEYESIFITDCVSCLSQYTCNTPLSIWASS